MKKLYSLVACVAMTASTCLPAQAQHRLPIIDAGVDIYAVCLAPSTQYGVYKLSSTENTPAQQPNRGEGVRAVFTSSGGAFVSETEVYGTWYTSYDAIYAIKLSADDNGWGTDWYSTSGANYMPYQFNITSTDMTYDPVSGNIYGWFRGDNYGYNWQFGTYSNPASNNATMTPIGSKTTVKITAIAATPTGELYGIEGASGKLYSIDKATGELTEKASLGIIAEGATQSAAIDPATGLMYWGAAPDTFSNQSLYKVDIAAGTAEKQYDFSYGQKFNAFYIPKPATSPAAPADLAATFTGTGTDMKVSFTAPTTTAGGVELSGELTYTIYANGESVKSDKTTAGANVEVTVSLPAGECKIEVACTNDSGEGKKATLQTFVGFDTPKAVTELTATADGQAVTLAWTAPVGEHNGTVDASKLSYTIVRNPGAVEVAKDLKETTFTDNVPEATIAGYTWTVTVVFDGTAAQSTTSESVLVGKPYTVPYSQNFNDVESLSDIAFATVNDETGNVRPSNTWTIAETDGNKYASNQHGFYFSNNDYLFTAPIEFFAGAKYTLKFKIAASANLQDNTVDVFLSKSQNNNADDFVQPYITAESIVFKPEAEQVNQFVEQTFEFTVAKSGAYCIAFHDHSTLYSSSALMIDDIELTGEFAAPGPVTDYTAVATGVGNRDVAVEFTLPVNDVKGNPLAGIEKVEISRGSTVLLTLDKNPDTDGALEPGATIACTIEGAPRGIGAFKVVVYSMGLASESAMQTLKVGFINELVISNVKFPTYVGKDSKENATCDVTNQAFEYAVDYRVVLYCDGVEQVSIPGEPLAMDEDMEYAFELIWQENAPESAKFQIKVEFFSDENPANNDSDEYTVNFEQVAGLDRVDASAISVEAALGQITVTGAAGAPVAIFATDGRMVASTSSASETYTVALPAGVYVVKAGEATFKVIL